MYIHICIILRFVRPITEVIKNQRANLLNN